VHRPFGGRAGWGLLATRTGWHLCKRAGTAGVVLCRTSQIKTCNSLSFCLRLAGCLCDLSAEGYWGSHRPENRGMTSFSHADLLEPWTCALDRSSSSTCQHPLFSPSAVSAFISVSPPSSSSQGHLTFCFTEKSEMCIWR
jgi:hypothetical protein